MKNELSAFPIKKEIKSALQRELLKRNAKENYCDYVEYVHEGAWVRAKALCYLCESVQDFLQKKTDNPYDIMVISMPPQHGKSMTITQTLPSFYLCKNPNKRVIVISYSEDFATLFGRRNREKILRFGKEFGVSLKITPNSVTEFELEQGAGSMISRGILSGVTGRACDLMIIDDPVKNRREADSETYRRRVFDEWENSFKTRLSAGAKVIIIQTRWHEDDLAGKIIKGEKYVNVINLPCECENEKTDPISRRRGEALCPELAKDTKWLKKFKEPYMTQNGTRAWNALFQGRPTGTQGGILKKNWWKFYENLPNVSQTVISCDAAFKGEVDSDFVAIQVWGKTNASIYLIEAIKAHMDFPQTLHALEQIAKEYPRASHVLIEDKANGSAIIQMLRRTLRNVIPVNPQGGKVSRVNAVSGVIEAGNVFLPLNADFTGGFIDECAEFPNGKHDDQVDCMSQALNRLIFYTASEEIKEQSPFGDFHLPFHIPKEQFLKQI